MSTIKNYAKSILEVESQAILNCLEVIDDTFEKAVQEIIIGASSSNLFISGIGKASFIAMKCSATFASTGVRSFFLHPTEALHGDLGRIHKNDIVILLSHSGKTAEVLQLIPSIKKIGSKIFAITANADSELAHYSDLCICTGSIAEACPLGLAPTASTAVMLAICDALAMSVLKERNFSAEDFARYHPGGQLGRNLTPVNQIMRKGEMHCVVMETETVRDVLHKISATVGRPGVASIISENGKLAGIFTDSDFRHCLEKGTDFLDQAISKVMTKSPITLNQDALAAEALRIITEKKRDSLIIVSKNNEPVGMLDVQDLVSLGNIY